MELVGPVGTELAAAAHRHNPLDASSVTLFPNILHAVTSSHHYACTLVSGYTLGAVLPESRMNY